MKLSTPPTVNSMPQINDLAGRMDSSVIQTNDLTCRTVSFALGNTPVSNWKKTKYGSHENSTGQTKHLASRTNRLMIQTNDLTAQTNGLIDQIDDLACGMNRFASRMNLPASKTP